MELLKKDVMKKIVMLASMCFFAVLLFSFSVIADNGWELRDGTLTISADFSDFNTPQEVFWSTYAEDVEKIEIEDGVTRIPAFSFWNFQKCTGVSLPDSLEEIGNYAFSGCVTLEDVVLPVGLKSVGISAFAYCARLVQLELPDSVQAVGREAFYGCMKLEKFTLSSSLETLEYNVFENCVSLKEVSFPSSITRIEHKAFGGCSSLARITIPSNVKYIGTSAFSGCTSLESFVIEEGLEIVDNWAFSYCPTLCSVKFPSTLLSLGDYAFVNCTALESVILGKSVAAVGNNSFKGCTALETVIVSNPDFEISNSVMRYAAGLEDFAGTHDFYENQFFDVTESDWFFENVKYAYECGLMFGKGENIFSPSENITVAQALALAARLHSIYYNGSGDFVQTEVWYEVYLDYCLSNGLADKSALPDMNFYVDRALFARLINVLPSAEFAFKNDISPPDSSSADAVLFYRAGVLAGCDSEFNFCPDSLITRAEVAAVLSRIVNSSQRISV